MRSDESLPPIFETRTGAHRSSAIRLAGRIDHVGPEQFGVEFTNGDSACFERLSDGRLKRPALTGSSRESEMTLAPARATPHEGDRKQIFLPPTLFNTMPKSGSIYILRCLSQRLRVGETKIAVCLFPDNLVIRNKLDELAMGNLISQQHPPAHDINLRFLANRLNRLVVYVRDPRQALLLWLHHLDKFNELRETIPELRARP